MIKVSELTRTYDDFIAINRLSFEIPQGQIVGLLGHNGAGKTTTMKVLTGFLEPTEGEVTLDGLNIVTQRLQAQACIGYLPENSPTYPEMTVLEYLIYLCDLRGLTGLKREAGLQQAVLRCGLRARLDDKIGTLSKGFRQRVGVAQAIVHQPKILILDEPTSGLDPTQILEMRSLIKDLSAKSTVIISTHILQEVQALCDRVLIILQGQLAKDELLNNLQSSHLIRVKTNAAPEQARSLFLANEEILEVTQENLGEAQTSYLLQAKAVQPALLHGLSKKILDAGWELYGLEHVERNLEALFKEINSSNKRLTPLPGPLPQGERGFP